MKKIIFFCLALISTNTIQAGLCEFCSEWCDPCSGWEFNIDWLYWNVRRSNLDFAVDGHTGNDFPDGKMKCVDIDYDHGFRIGALKECDEFDVGLHYAHFKTEENRRSFERIGDIVPTRMHPGNSTGLGDVNTLDYARANYKASIDSVELALGKKIEIDEGTFIRPACGFSYASICQAMHTVYQEDDQGVTGVRIKQKLDMGAYGLFVGSGASFGFCECYSIFGHFSGGVYVGDFDASYSEYQFDGPRLGHGEKGDRLVHATKCQTLVVGSYELSLGIAYDLCEFMCMDWKLSAGYEFHEWCGLPGFIHFTDDSTRGALTRNGSTFGWDGLFLRGSATF